MSRKTFYIYSSLSIFFQFYFLILAKDFTDDFFIYIQLISISSLLNGVFGSIQFFFQNKRTISIRKEILIFYLCLKILIFIFCSIKYDFLIGFVFIILSLNLCWINLISAKAAYKDMLTSNSKYLFFVAILKFFSVYFSILLEASFLNLILFFTLINLIASVYIYGKIEISFDKNGYSFKSSLITFLGSSLFSLDKIFISLFFPKILIPYFLINRISSIFQIFSEIFFREERFKITSGKKIRKYLGIVFKLILLFLILLLIMLIINFWNLNLNEIYFLEKFKNLNKIFLYIYELKNYKLEIFLMSSSFILNSTSGLWYDRMYKNLYENYLLIINFLNMLVLLILFTFYANDLKSFAISLFVIQIFNLITVFIFFRKKFQNYEL